MHYFPDFISSGLLTTARNDLNAVIAGGSVAILLITD